VNRDARHSPPRLRLSIFAMTTVAGVLAHMAGPAVAAIPMNSENVMDKKIPLSHVPAFLTAGPDGLMWVTEDHANLIARIGPSGRVKEFYVGESTTPSGITVGPDGNIWVALSNGNAVLRIGPGGALTKFNTPSLNPNQIITGPDGHLWFTSPGSSIGRMSVSGDLQTFVASGYPQGIAAGPDGNVWFAAEFGDHVARITPTGEITEFPTGFNSLPVGMTTGPDGNLWFTELSGQIVRMTPEGDMVDFPVPNPTSAPAWITVGPDGNLWFTNLGVDAPGGVGFVTVDGHVREFVGNVAAQGIAVGPDGRTIWFAEELHEAVIAFRP
jgi:streptogramin lyase